MQKYFQMVPHTADFQVRVFAKTKQELFINALKAMTFSRVDKVDLNVVYIQDGEKKTFDSQKTESWSCENLYKKRSFDISSTDIDALLVDFLSEALTLSDIYSELYLDALVYELTDTGIRGSFCGIEVSRFNVVEIKAVTYHGLRVHQEGDLWQTDIVFDI